MKLRKTPPTEGLVAVVWHDLLCFFIRDLARVVWHDCHWWLWWASGKIETPLLQTTLKDSDVRLILFARLRMIRNELLQAGHFVSIQKIRIACLLRTGIWIRLDNCNTSGDSHKPQNAAHGDNHQCANPERHRSGKYGGKMASHRSEERREECQQDEASSSDKASDAIMERRSQVLADEVLHFLHNVEWWHRRGQAPTQLVALSPVATHGLIGI
jgi:hypothetical protein